MTTYNDIRTNFYRFENSNARGNDLQRMGTQTLYNCLRSCYNDDDCLAFTTTAFDSSDSSGDCNLKRYTDTNFYPWWEISEDTNWKIYVKNINKRRNITRKNWDKTGFNRWFPEFTCIRSAVPSLNNSLQLKDDPSRCGQIDNVHLPGSDIINVYNCQTIDSDKMCFVTDDFKGTCAVSPCEFSNDTNKGWSFYTQDQKYGSINCKYSFDYTNFSFNNLSNFVKYINTLYSDKVGIDTDSKNRFRDSNYIYACILDFYSSIYGQYYYSGRNAINNFKNFDYLRNGIYQYKNSNIFPFINSQIQKHFTGGIVPSELEHIVDNSLQLPTPIITAGTPGIYTINLNVSYDMYKEYKDKNQQSRDTYISNLMEGFLRDTEGNIQDILTGNSWFSKRCDITSTNITMIYAVDVSRSTYTDSTSINPEQYNDTDYKNYLFLYCTITGTVNVWTPMLSVYFQVKATNGSENLDIVTCNAIAEKAGYNSSDISLYPYICFQRLCSRLDKSECINNMVNSCKLNYTPPAPFSTNINKYLTNKDSLQCQCYTSTISPISESQAGNIAAMCFDKKCSDPELTQGFNLSDSNCKQYIDKVWNWIYSPNTQEKSRNSQTFDTAKFNRLAGKEYQPYQPASYNWQLLVIGIFTIVLLCLISFILCRKYDISTVFTVINLVIIILIFGGLTAFFCKDMAGLSSCDGKEFKCKSRYTDIELPNEFCNYTLNCECQFNEDCSPCSYCFSGTCAPVNGTRKTITVSERKPNVVVLILSIILLVLLPTILIFLHDKKFLNIPAWLFNTIVIIACLIPLGFILYNSLKKVEFTKYDGSCTQECDDSCEGKTCGYNGCGQLCGTCQPGYQCNTENICEIFT